MAPQDLYCDWNQSILDLTLASAEGMGGKKELSTCSYYTYDHENNLKWGASLLGQFVLSCSGNSDLLEDAWGKLGRVYLEDDCNAAVLMYTSLLNTHRGIVCEDDDGMGRLYHFLDARYDIQRAIALKNGRDQLYLDCQAFTLKVQKAVLKANNPTELIQRACRYFSDGKQHDDSGTAAVDFEDLIQCLRKQVDRENQLLEDMSEEPILELMSGEDEDEEEAERTLRSFIEYMLHLQRRAARDMKGFGMQMWPAWVTVDGGSSACSNAEESKDVESTVADFRDFTLLAIFEQFQRSAEAIYAKDSHNADNLTMWGAALLGVSVHKSNGDSKACLEDAVSKFELALAEDGNKTDASAGARNAKLALYMLRDTNHGLGEFLRNSQLFIPLTSGEGKKVLPQKRKLEDSWGPAAVPVDGMLTS